MCTILRFAWPFFLLLSIMQGARAQLAYEPVGLGWSAEEVERLAAFHTRTLTDRAERAGRLGCRLHCQRLERVFLDLVPLARRQTTRSLGLPWTLTIVNLPEVDAQVMSGGRVLISEDFIERRVPSDAALAFVLAHEMAHDILEHERQSLSYARLLLPREPARSVRDMYVEMDFNFALRRDMAPVMQQGELEADELGFLMASAAGYDPDAQLAFLEGECVVDPGRQGLLASHPTPCARLLALRARLPLARRQIGAYALTPEEAPGRPPLP